MPLSSSPSSEPSPDFDSLVLDNSDGLTPESDPIEILDRVRNVTDQYHLGTPEHPLDLLLTGLSVLRRLRGLGAITDNQSDSVVERVNHRRPQENLNVSELPTGTQERSE